MIRPVALFLLLALMLFLRSAQASRAADEALAAEISEVLAANETELLALRARLAFLRDKMESNHPDEALLLLDDEAVIEARQSALLGALDERGLAPDMKALEGELYRGIASLEADRIVLQVEVDRYRELRDAGDDERLVLALPDGVVRPARHLARQLAAAVAEDARNAQTYGTKHPTRVAAAITHLEE
ncbi:MAG: hypothetical protein QGH45_06490 [Myxococcota bacterium]|nr:hypothetical protein [Myxococcota bacterium]